LVEGIEYNKGVNHIRFAPFPSDRKIGFQIIKFFLEPRQRANLKSIYRLTVLRSTAVTGRTLTAACRGEGSINDIVQFNRRLPDLTVMKIT